MPEGARLDELEQVAARAGLHLGHDELASLLPLVVQLRADLAALDDFLSRQGGPLSDAGPPAGELEQ
jgi:hypothetical protein